MTVSRVEINCLHLLKEVSFPVSVTKTPIKRNHAENQKLKTNNVYDSRTYLVKNTERKVIYTQTIKANHKNQRFPSI